jgi:flap endonuclease-1
MGIKGLRKFIEKYAPSAIKELKIEDLQNKTIAFDTSILIYQFVIAIRNSGVDLTNDNGKITSHVHAIIMKTLSFLKKKINPIFIFDGKPPEIKMDTLKERIKVRQDAIAQLETETELENDKKISLLKQSVVITSKQMDECKEILKLIGIPVIDALQEADAQCAYLSKLKLVDAIASEDMDLLTFGTEKLLRNMNTNKIMEITLSKILEETELTQNQFIDLCIMLGSDYCPTINGIGMTRAYSLIKKYESLENIINANIKIGKNNVIICNEFRSKYQLAREYFKNPPVNKNFPPIKWNNPDFDNLKNILITKYSYSPITVDKLLVKPLTGGHYKEIVGKNNNQVFIDREFSIHMNILNIQKNVINNDDQFLDDIDDNIINIHSPDPDVESVNNLLKITDKNNIKSLVNFKTI